MDTAVDEIFGDSESRRYPAKDYDKGRFLTLDGEVETDPSIGSESGPPLRSREFAGDAGH